jgi:DNA-binding response OmpR family regulator
MSLPIAKLRLRPGPRRRPTRTIALVDPDRVDATEPAAGPATARRVLVIEDDPTLSDVVARYLRRDGFTVEVCGDGPGGLERALDWLPDLVVLDLMLPGMDGLEVCERLRSAAPIPVVMLTARAEEDDRVLGLEIGADDYVTKPFSPRELTARIKAVLRRAAGPLSPSADPADADGRRLLAAGEIEVDTVAREVRRAGDAVHLTAKEYDLLVHLMRHPRVAFDRSELLEQVWGWTYGDAATVTVHVRRLRTKVEQDPGTPRHLVTVTGGYRFEP